MNRATIKLLTIVSFGVFIGCSLEKDIDVKIPEFKDGYVIEAYAAPDVPFRMLVSRSNGFFEIIDTDQLNQGDLDIFLGNGMEGYIEVNGNRYFLENEIGISPGTKKIFNYRLRDHVTLRENDNLVLSLTLPSGETVHSNATVPALRPVDSIRLIENDKNEVRELSFASTDSTKTEYFRRQLIRISDGKSQIVQDFTIDNKSAKGGQLAFGSGFEFQQGDTLISRLIHIEKAYFNFFNSVTGSVNANTNPFGQPGIIASNITGSDRVIGIFTGINPSEIFKPIGK